MAFRGGGAHEFALQALRFGAESVAVHVLGDSSLEARGGVLVAIQNDVVARDGLVLLRDDADRSIALQTTPDDGASGDASFSDR